MKSLPKWADGFLRTICPDDLFDQITGDLIELYHHDVKSIGERKAKVRLAITIMRFLRPGILLRNKISLEFNRGPMLQHYLKTSYRHFLKSKLNFSFKVLGLVLAMSSLLVIVLFVSYQLSFSIPLSVFVSLFRIAGTVLKAN